MLRAGNRSTGSRLLAGADTTVTARPLARLAVTLPSVSTQAVAAVAVFGALALGCLARGLDTDLWWHLFDGNYIINHLAVPRSDFLSFTVQHHAWNDFEWLSEAAMAGLYRAGGLWLVQIGFALLTLASFALVQRQSQKLGTNGILASFLTLVGFAASFTFLGARPQIVTLLMLAVFAILLHDYRETKSRRLLLLFPPLTVLWANLHAGFALGLGLVFLTVAGDALNGWSGKGSRFWRGDVAYLAAAGVASAVAALLNPYGFQEMLFPLSQLTGSPFTAAINEWQSPNFHQITMLPFELLFMLFVVAAIVAKREVDWTHVLLIVVFTGLALSAIRNIPIWCVVLLPVLGLYVQSGIDTLRRQSSPAFGKHKSVTNFGAALGLVALFAVVGVRDMKPGLLRTYEREEFPTAAATYLSTHKLGPNVFATYSWGAYLEWRLYPRYRDFIDGRANTVFSNGTLKAYLNIYNAQGPWRRQLARFKVDDIVVETGAPVATAIRRDPRWRLVYRSSGTVLFARS